MYLIPMNYEHLKFYFTTIYLKNETPSCKVRIITKGNSNPFHFSDQETKSHKEKRQEQDPGILIPSIQLIIKKQTTKTKYNKKKLKEAKWDKDNKVGRIAGGKKMRGKLQEHC